MITERSKEVDDRQRLGDWELDTVVGKREKMVLITAVERKTRYTVAVKARDRTNREITKRLISAFRGQPIPVFTMTADNGIEFSGHCKVKKALKCEFFFALPHHPWERGTNENTNGLLRQYFPKRETLEHITPKEVSSAVQRLNSRPRKCLNFMTPEGRADRTNRFFGIALAILICDAKYIDKKMTALVSRAVKSDSEDLPVTLRLHIA